MTEDETGGWDVDWTKVIKGLTLGVGFGLVLAVSLGDFWYGLLLGVVGGLSFGFGWARSTR